ncbi:MAG: hypothetical protein Q4Q04_01320 [Methanocorpusculum sp.]|nr:hypothetical protein [Methanocorpusculum sp.]
MKTITTENGTPSRFGFTNKGEIGIMKLLSGVAIGILTLIIIYSLVPVVGASVDDAMPDISGQWNTTTNPDIPTGVDLWETMGPLIGLAALVAVIAIVLKMIGVF